MSDGVLKVTVFFRDKARKLTIKDVLESEESPIVYGAVTLKTENYQLMIPTSNIDYLLVGDEEALPSIEMLESHAEKPRYSPRGKDQ